MKPSLLQRVDAGHGKPASSGGFRFLIYVVSVVVAFFAGEYYAHLKSLPIAPMTAPLNVATGPMPTAVMPAQTPPPPAVSATRATEPTAGVAPQDIRVEKAVPVAPAASAAMSPAAQSQAVTIVEPVEIPVKEGDKIVGYINLQRGQRITPISVENDRIKIKCGANFVFVPVKATDMAHR